MRQSTLNAIKQRKDTASNLLGLVINDPTVSEEGRNAIKEAARSGHDHEAILGDVLAGANVTEQDEAPWNGESMLDKALDVAGPVLKAGAPIVGGILGAYLGPFGGAASRLTPQIATGLNSALGMLAGRAATGQNPVSPESGADVAAAMMPPLAAAPAARMTQPILGPAVRAGLSALGGAGAAEAGAQMIRGEPAGAGERLIGGGMGALGQLVDELAMGVRPDSREIAKIQQLEAIAPTLKNKLSPALAGPADSARMKVLDVFGTDPFMTNPALQNQMSNIALATADVSGRGLPPTVTPDSLEAIAEMIRTGKISDEVAQSKTFQTAVTRQFSKKKEAVENMFGAALDPFKKMNAPVPADPNLKAELSDLMNRFMVDPNFAASPAAGKVRDMIGASDLAPSQIVQTMQDLKPSGTRQQAAFNEQARLVLADWLDKKYPKESSALRSAKSEYRTYAQNRDVVESGIEKGVSKPQEAWSKPLQEGMTPEQSTKEALRYFNAEGDFDAAAKNLAGQLPAEVGLKEGFKDSADLVKAAVDPDRPDRAIRSWRLLNKYVPAGADIDALRSSFNGKMLLKTKDSGVVADPVHFVRRFKQLSPEMAKQIYGPNYQNVSDFVDGIAPYLDNLSAVLDNPQYMAQAARTRSSAVEYTRQLVAKPILQIVGPIGAGAAGAAGTTSPATTLLLTAGFVLGPSVLGKMMLNNAPGAIDLVRGVVKAAQVVGITGSERVKAMRKQKQGAVK